MPQNLIIHRPTTLRTALLQALEKSCLSIGLMTLAHITHAAPGWDCKIGADGQSWQCEQDSATAPEVSITTPVKTRVETQAYSRPVITTQSTKPLTAQPITSNDVSTQNKITSKPKAKAMKKPSPVKANRTVITKNVEKNSSIKQTATSTTAIKITGAASYPPIHTRLDDGINWQNCSQANELNLQTAALNTDSLNQPIDISADSVEASSIYDQATFTGNVHLQQGEQEIFAEQITYKRSTSEIDANGNIFIKRPDLRISASQAQYNLNTGQGDLIKAEYRLPSILARGTAEHVQLTDTNNSQYKKISYTTCRPGNNDWMLNADHLALDTAKGIATTNGAKLNFKGIPLLYLPTLTFPIDGNRHSGVLVPKVGYSNNQGFDLAVPYYINLANNYDLTLTPRLMSKRGTMLSAEFRFLTESTAGVIDASFIPNDKLSTQNSEQRGSLSVQAQSQFNKNLSADLRFNYVSDNNFLSDLGNNLELTSTSYLERAAEIRYTSDDWQALGRIQQFQTIDAAITMADRPYARLPQLAFSMEKEVSDLPINFQLDGEFVHFVKDGGFVEGKRFDIQPSISFIQGNDWSYITPKASVRYTKYSLDNQTIGLSNSPDRLSGIFSVDSGLFYDRDTQYFGQNVSQTLEPRLYYLYVPNQNHSDIPVFDTNFQDFSFENLFSENRFNGADRLGDANQLTFALTSRINNSNNGKELLRASIGQIVYFKDRTVTLPGSTINNDSSSAVVGELAAELGGGWRTRAGLEWDPHTGSNGTINQALGQVSYRDTNSRIFNASYRLRDGVSSHSDIAAIWPLSNNTHLIGRWNYSLSEQRNLEALAGVEYSSCCWRVRAVARQHSDNTNNDQNLGFFIQLELNGLGKLGDNIEDLLNNGIYGYRKDNE